MSQDPLENFFGCQRQRGGANENPNVAQFCKNTQALRVINSICGTVSKSNSRGNKNSIDLQAESKPLPKRRKAKKKKVPMKTFPPTFESVPLSASLISNSGNYSTKLLDLPEKAIGEENSAAILNTSESEDPRSNFLLKTDCDMNNSEDIESPELSPFFSDEKELPLTNQHQQASNYCSHHQGVLSTSTSANCIRSKTESASDHEHPGESDSVIMESSDDDIELSKDKNSSNNLPEISCLLDTVVMGSSGSDMELSEDNDNLSGVLDTAVMELSYSDIELSEDNDSSSNLLKILGLLEHRSSGSDMELCEDNNLSGVLDTAVMGSDTNMKLSKDNISPDSLPEISTASEDKDEFTDCILFDSPMSGIISDNPTLHPSPSEDMTDSRPTSTIVRPKSLAEEDKITNALATTGLAGEKITRLFNITLRHQDFWTLRSMEWLNDQVILCLLFTCNYVLKLFYIVGH